MNARVPGEAIDSSDKGNREGDERRLPDLPPAAVLLPTGDPDPDSERPEGTPLPTADEVTAQIKAALEAADPLAALEGIAAHHGDGNVSRGRNILSRVTLTRADGSQADADTIVGELYGKTQTELAQRVDQARAEQDAAAEGPARDVHDEQPVDESPAGPQPQAGQEAPPEPTPQPAQDTQPVQDAPPVEGNAQTTLRTLMFTEIKAQAAVLDVDPVQYVDPIVRSLGLGTINDVGQGHLGQLGTWMHRQRRHVISALNERGNGPAATAVAALTAQQVADEPTVLLMLGEDARQPEPAEADRQGRPAGCRPQSRSGNSRDTAHLAESLVRGVPPRPGVQNTPGGQGSWSRYATRQFGGSAASPGSVVSHSRATSS